MASPPHAGTVPGLTETMFAGALGESLALPQGVQSGQHEEHCHRLTRVDRSLSPTEIKWGGLLGSWGEQCLSFGCPLAGHLSALSPSGAGRALPECEVTTAQTSSPFPPSSALPSGFHPQKLSVLVEVNLGDHTKEVMATAQQTPGKAKLRPGPRAPPENLLHPPGSQPGEIRVLKTSGDFLPAPTPAPSGPKKLLRGPAGWWQCTGLGAGAPGLYI